MPATLEGVAQLKGGGPHGAPWSHSLCPGPRLVGAAPPCTRPCPRVLAPLAACPLLLENRAFVHPAAPRTQVAIIASKRLRNKIAGFATHLMRRIQRGPVRGISLKLQARARKRSFAASNLGRSRERKGRRLSNGAGTRGCQPSSPAGVRLRV